MTTPAPAASPWPDPATEADELAVKRALAGLEEMSEAWAGTINLTRMIATVLEKDDRESRVEALMHLAWQEGAYAGRMSHEGTARVHATAGAERMREAAAKWHEDRAAACDEEARTGLGADGERTGRKALYARADAHDHRSHALSIRALALPDALALDAVIAEAEERGAAPLIWLAQNPDCELTHGGWEDDEQLWKVHAVNGGRNDREWTLLGEGVTPGEAIQAAIRALAGGTTDAG